MNVRAINEYPPRTRGPEPVGRTPVGSEYQARVASAAKTTRRRANRVEDRRPATAFRSSRSPTEHPAPAGVMSGPDTDLGLCRPMPCVSADLSGRNSSATPEVRELQHLV